MLATLYAKALDAEAEHPILGDAYAKDLVERLDVDWRQAGMNAKNSPSAYRRWRCGARTLTTGHVSF